MGSPTLVGPDGMIAEADLSTVSKRLDPHIPPAMPPVSARMVADALAPDSDQIIVFLAEVSPVAAHGVAVRIRYPDLTNSAPVPVDVRLGGPCCTTTGDAEPMPTRGPLGHADRCDCDQCEEWRHIRDSREEWSV